MYYTTASAGLGRWRQPPAPPLLPQPMPPFSPRLHVLAGALVALVVGCQRPAPPVVKLPVPEVTVAVPVAREVTDFVEFTGNATAVETVMIKARVSGFITQVLFLDGQSVRQGDPLFSIDDRPYSIARDVALAEIARQQADLNELQSEVTRNDALVQRGAVTQEQAGIVRAKRDVAAALLDKAKAGLRQADLDLEFCRVVAPIDGRIGTRNVTVGDLVSGATGSATTLSTVVNSNPVYVTFNADERSLLLSRERAIVRQRQQAGNAAADVQWHNIKDLAIPVEVALVTDEGFPRAAVLDFVDIAVKASTGTVRCRAVLENPDGLIAPGMFVRLRMPFGDPQPALLVPDRALGFDQGRPFLAIVKGDNTVEHRTVVPGLLVPGEKGGLRVIREGLQSDQRVVISGLQRAREGSIVKPIEGAVQ